MRTNVDHKAIRMSVIKLVQDDTAPDIDVTLIDQSTGEPFDVSHAEDVVRFHFKKLGELVPKATIICSKINGGADGAVRIEWGTSDLDTPGNYEGEIEISLNTGKITSVYNVLRFLVRKRVG